VNCLRELMYVCAGHEGLTCESQNENYTYDTDMLSGLVFDS
jgi:hypothetical protein